MYPWGLLITDTDETRSDPVVDLSPTPAGEQDLACHGYQRLRMLRAQARQAEGDLSVFHYTPVEVRHPLRLSRQAHQHDSETLAEARALLADCCIDGHPIVCAHYPGVDGLRPNKVATATGFIWRDTDPGEAHGSVTACRVSLHLGVGITNWAGRQPRQGRPGDLSDPPVTLV